MLRESTLQFVEKLESLLLEAPLAGADCGDCGALVDAEVDAYLVATQALIAAVLDRIVALRCGRAEPT